MCNFQDVFLQKSQSLVHFGAMKVLYWLAKELQLLDPARFDNIFLGLGGFDSEEVMIACCGKYLEDTGIDSVLVENEVYGPENVKHLINGGHYTRGIRGMVIISEVLYGLLLRQFLIEKDENTENQVVQQVKGTTQLINETNNQSTKYRMGEVDNKNEIFGIQRI